MCALEATSPRASSPAFAVPQAPASCRQCGPRWGLLIFQVYRAVLGLKRFRGIFSVAELPAIFHGHLNPARATVPCS